MEAIYKEIFLPTRASRFNIIALGDTHIGHPNFDSAKFLNTISYIKNTPNTYAIFTGDVADKRDPDHKFYDPGQVDQKFDLKHFQWNCYKYFKKHIAPIKDKMIGIHEGNHDRSGRATHYIEEICEDLSIPFLGYRAVIALSPKFERCMPNKAIIIFSTHGSGGGRKTGGKINRIEDEEQSTEADIYIQGHTHYLSFTSRIKLVPYVGKRPAGIKIHEKQMLFINTGSYLKSYQLGNYCYSEKYSYPPQQTGCVKINIYDGCRKSYRKYHCELMI